MVLSPALAEFLLFHPSRRDPGPPPVLAGIRGEDLTLEAADGVAVRAWWYDVERQVTGAPLVLFLHGNAGDIGDRTPIAEGLIGEGLSVMLLEYRGYGGSEGKPSEDGLHQDALAGWDFLLRKGGDPERIVLLGRSMGGAVASRLAVARTPGGLILESSFTSLKDIGQSVYPILPGFLLTRLRGLFDTRGWVERVEAPVLVIHGTEDEIVPFHMGMELFEAAGKPKEWFPVRGATHNDVYWVGGSPYFKRIGDFARLCVRGELPEEGTRP